MEGGIILILVTRYILVFLKVVKPKSISLGHKGYNYLYDKMSNHIVAVENMHVGLFILHISLNLFSNY